MRHISTGTYGAAFDLNGIRVFALSDGYVDIPADRLQRVGRVQLGSDYPPEVPLFDGNLRLAVNAFVIPDDTGLTLIDTGASDSWFPTMGRLFEAFDEAGLACQDVHTVALTHVHEDHRGGLIAPDGSDGFPNMERLFVPRAEIPLLRSDARLERFHDRATPFDDGAQIGPQITALAAPGHEVGHTVFKLQSGDETLLIWGDIVHVPSAQFAQPDLAWGADFDQEMARKTRHRILELACAPNTWVCGAHLDFPGTGKVTRSDGAYAFTALD